MKKAKWFHYLLIAIVAIFMLVVISGYIFYKQNSWTALIIVVDDSGVPINQAYVKVLRFSIGPPDQYLVDNEGRVVVTSFMPAIEMITASAPGYKSETYMPSMNNDRTKVFVLKPEDNRRIHSDHHSAGVYGS